MLTQLGTFALEHSRALLVTLEVVWLVVLSCYILLERRPPASTLAWIFGLAALPAVGFLVYYFAGPRRFSRRKLRRRGAKDAVARLTEGTEGPWAEAAPEQRPLMLLAARLAGSSPEVATTVQIYGEADPLYDDMVAAIAASTEHVHAEYYIFRADRAGERIRDALCERARAGVRVRLLVDALGSSGWSRAFRAPFSGAGVELAMFNSAMLGSVRRRIVNFRTHRKILVCDGKVGFTGGINVCDDQSARAHGAEAWRDTHVRVSSDAVHGLQRVFLEDWLYATHRRSDSLGELARYFPAAEAAPGEPVQIVGSGPDQDRYAIEAVYLDAISRAGKRVWLTTPYFVPPDTILAALCNAAVRGVDVQLLVPRKTDSALVDAASRTYWEPLFRAGVQIYEYRPRMVHAKTAVIDGWLGIVGTANLDYRSLRLNFEVSALLYGRGTIDRLAALFEEDRALASRMKPRRLRFLRRLAQSAARVFAPQL